MIIRYLSLAAFLLMLNQKEANAQLFETRTTRFAKVDILAKFQANGTPEQVALRDSLIQSNARTLLAGEVIETFFDDYHMGLVVYKNSKPHRLIGFWDPKGVAVQGGQLSNGNGTVKTPFNPSLIQNFKHESVVYQNGSKNGEAFYYCDCASVLRRGKFTENQKEGLWKEYSPQGDFIKQKRIKIETVKVDEIKIKEKKWLEPAHCMMRNPDEDIKCPIDN